MRNVVLTQNVDGTINGKHDLILCVWRGTDRNICWRTSLRYWRENSGWYEVYFHLASTINIIHKCIFSIVETITTKKLVELFAGAVPTRNNLFNMPREKHTYIFYHIYLFRESFIITYKCWYMLALKVLVMPVCPAVYFKVTDYNFVCFR